jgi:hypothetical protein
MVGLEGEERLGNCRQKLGIPPRFVGDSHQNDRYNF